MATDLAPINSCEPLPSQDAACAAITRGDAQDWFSVVKTTAARAALIGAGLYVFDRKDKHLVGRSIAAATAIEVFVLGWTAYHKAKERVTATEPTFSSATVESSGQATASAQ